ncbi:MAG: hypothetical protein HY851_09570 [candidate division Zixibacteria bacterium]|nr:hypothetical protein [candidate division Zixibacteria bacterium]
MSPRRVLLVCYYFPPLGMGGIGRPVNLFQELPRLGWDCHVLTVKGVAYRGYERELAASLDQSRIHRAGSYDPQRLLYLLGVRQVGGTTIERTRAASSRFFPDSKVGWVGPAVRLARKLCREHTFDVVLTTSPPISSHLIGRQVAQEFNIPWVADFRDYWTVEPIEKAYHTESFVRRGNDLLDRIRSGADALTAVNHSIRSYLTKGDVIRNAYNEHQALAWVAPPSSDRYRIGLPGNQTVSITWEPLLDAIADARHISSAIDSRIELVQVGQIDPSAFRQEVERRSLKCRLSLHGQVSRTSFIEALNTTHLIYLGVPKIEGLQFIPGRIYDLLPSGRPILCNAPQESEIAEILRPTGNALCFEETQIRTAVQYLADADARFRAGTLGITPRPAYATPYGSSTMAGQFANLFEQFIK